MSDPPILSNALKVSLRQRWTDDDPLTVDGTAWRRLGRKELRDDVEAADRGHLLPDLPERS